MYKEKLPILLVFSFLIFLYFNLLLFPIKALAESKSIQVNVSVGDLLPPSAPILISPENGAYIASNQPLFIFLASTDNKSGIDKYQLFLDNELYIDNIFSNLTTIIVSAIAKISEGRHFWYIKVYDKTGNYALSPTWSFVVDTTPPFIILTSLEENSNLNFSSADLSTIPPETTIITRSRRPAFFGQGEPGSTIQINFRNKKSYQFITTVNDNGSFAFIPGENIFNDTYEITIVSFDKAGNTILLPSFKLIIEAPPKRVIPLCWLIIFFLLIAIIILFYLYSRERKKYLNIVKKE